MHCAALAILLAATAAIGAALAVLADGFYRFATVLAVLAVAAIATVLAVATDFANALAAVLAVVTFAAALAVLAIRALVIIFTARPMATVAVPAATAVITFATFAATIAVLASAVVEFLLAVLAGFGFVCYVIRRAILGSAFAGCAGNRQRVRRQYRQRWQSGAAQVSIVGSLEALRQRSAAIPRPMTFERICQLG